MCLNALPQGSLILWRGFDNPDRWRSCHCQRQRQRQPDARAGKTIASACKFPICIVFASDWTADFRLSCALVKACSLQVDSDGLEDDDVEIIENSNRNSRSHNGVQGDRMNRNTAQNGFASGSGGSASGPS